MPTPQIKLIIWDLDDTLWRGTLADGDRVELHAHRAALVRAFNARGVVSSICSKNDFATAQAQLEHFGLWDAFVFPHIAFTPKPDAIRAIIADMQLRPANVLFVDDNPLNLREVRHCLADIQTLDITEPDADAALQAILDGTPDGRDRVAEYRMLERKRHDRTAQPAQSNEDFLRNCEIQACATTLMDNLEFVDRIAELINRSNQLNYTQSRVERDQLERDIMDFTYHSWAIFAWDRYGQYGLIGFVMVERATKQFRHFTFSCRIMHMGLEEYALGKVRTEWPQVDTSCFDGRFSHTAPDWIADRSFAEPAIRTMLRTEQGQAVPANPAIRIMIDCQSGGLAHFSHFRSLIDFDNYPRVFGLSMLIDGRHHAQSFPPLIVYGAGIDYADPRWPAERQPFLELGLYQHCVAGMVAFLRERDLRTLVVLPSEQLPEAKYRPHYGQTRERVARFNALWRRAALENPDHIWILDIAHVGEADEMSDLVHYHAGLIQKLSAQMDLWVQTIVSTSAAAA